MNNWLTGALTAGAILGGIGYAIGQLFSSRRKGISDSLETAISEISILRGKDERRELEMHDLRGELVKMRAENQILKDLLVGGAPFINALEQSVQEAVGKHTALILEAIHNEFEKRGAL